VIPIADSPLDVSALGAAVLVLAFAAAGPPGAACVLAQPTAETAVGRGDRLMAEFRTEAAVEAYRAGLVTSPADAELLWKTARALSNLADETPGETGDEARMEEAVGLSRRAVRAGPSISRAHTTLAASLGKLALFRGGKQKVELAREVGREARRAAELDPGDFAPFTVLGVLERELATLNPFLRGFAGALFGGVPDASLERSAALLERATRLGPGFVAPHLELARTYEEMDREAEARAELEKALDLQAREQLDRVLQSRARELLRELS
jgi:tetratricopeptide (TPR) repeat protein